MEGIFNFTGRGFRDRSDTLKFRNYIILSVSFHLLFFGILAATHSNGHEREQVFNVDIVEIEPLKTPEIKRSRQVLKKRQSTSRRRRPLAKSQPPNTIWDESPDSPSTQGRGAEALAPAAENKKGSPAGKNETGSLPDKGLKAVREEEATPSFLFDREVIEKYASKSPRPEKGLTFDTSEFEHRGYMRRLKEKIEGIWEYPKEAVRNKMSGDLYITFTIKRKGDLGEIELVRTSGHRRLDRAAIKALKDAAPFWPLPDDWPEDELEIKGHFIYLYGRTHVM